MASDLDPVFSSAYILLPTNIHIENSQHSFYWYARFEYAQLSLYCCPCGSSFVRCTACTSDQQHMSCRMRQERRLYRCG